MVDFEALRRRAWRRKLYAWAYFVFFAAAWGFLLWVFDLRALSMTVPALVMCWGSMMRIAAAHAEERCFRAISDWMQSHEASEALQKRD